MHLACPCLKKSPLLVVQVAKNGNWYVGGGLGGLADEAEARL